jgi:flagellar hook-basal body complex protein FliE
MIDPTSASSIQSMMETIRSYQSQAASSTQAAGMANSASSAQQMGMNGFGGVGANVGSGATGAVGSTTGAFQAKNISAPTTELPNFTDSVRNLLNKVNDVNVNSERMADAYQRGEDIPLTDVVLGMQKASLSFEATLQVRNKVLKAYEDIMNMPV